jgi:UDP-4-amino-4-deoxy-L-arabinose-oxoglutarate aminotransferase
MKVEFYRHPLGREERDAVVEALQTTFLTTGKKCAEFEQAFAGYLGVNEVVTTSSCTAALHLALIALGVGDGDEVITAPMSFVATANATLMVGATPRFVDVDPGTGLIDLDLVEAAITSRTKAVIPIHLYGQMVDMRRLRALADRHGLLIVEDAAHAIEAERDGVRPGQLGDAACFSFYATKNITCGEGGALATRRSAVAEGCRQLRNHGMTRSAAARYTGRYEHWDMEQLGWKYNLTDFQASMLLPQLRRIDQLWSRRDEIARHYEAAFASAGIEFPQVLRDRHKSARHLFTIWVDDAGRDQIMWQLQEAGVGVAVNYRPIHLTAFYRGRFGHEPGEFPQAERIGRRTISLPFYPGLRDDEMTHVIASVTRVCATKQDVRV